MLFLVVTLLPLAVLTQAPFAKSAAAEQRAGDAAEIDALSDAFAAAELVKAFTFPPEEQGTDFTSWLFPAEERARSPLFTVSDPGSPDSLFALRALPDRDAYADWLAQRLVEIVAQKDTATPPPMVRFILPDPPPAPPAPLRAMDVIPMYDVWVSLLQDQPRPKRADEFLPDLKRIFAEEGVPEELAWLPEIESMFNPRARNRIGARGLFQFMPGTALEQGLRLRPYDERVHPEKSARAAAVLLRHLHETFDSWPLALAAYNAGEHRVRRTLDARDANTFAEIAHALPAETRLYVPRVLATLAVREGYDPALLAAPRVVAVD